MTKLLVMTMIVLWAKIFIFIFSIMTTMYSTFLLDARVTLCEKMASRAAAASRRHLRPKHSV